MKFALYALLGAATASASNFLQETILELDAVTTPVTTPVVAQIDYTTTAAWKPYAITNKIGEVQCQPHEGAIIWDLKPVDAHKSIDYVGKGQSGFGDHTFAVELCENSFPHAKMPSYNTTGDSAATYTVNPNSITQGNAYWTTVISGTDTFTPEQSFLSGQFQSVQDETTNAFTGWTVTYASLQPCVAKIDTPQPFVFTITGVCDAKQKTGVYSEYTTGECSAGVTYTGDAGCVKFNGLAVWKAIKPFTGVILILFGGIMTFLGAKFLYQLVSGVACMVVFIVFYLIISNLFFNNETKDWIKYSIMFLAFLLGLGGGFVAFKFASTIAVPTISGIGGAFGFKLLANVAGVRHEYAVLAILVAGFIAGAALGQYFKQHVSTIGTAFLGSYLLVRGAGNIFGGFPDQASDIKTHNIKVGDKIVWYFGGFIVFFIAGAVFQYHFTDQDKINADRQKNDEDVFKGTPDDDDNKKCGCF